MNAVVFASEQEARVFLKQYERGRFDGLAEGEIVQDDTVVVTITGIGKIKAALRTDRLLRSHKVRRVLHVGTATALADVFTLGQVVAVEQVFEGDRIELSAPTYPRMPLDIVDSSLKATTLVTQDHTPQDEKERTYWQRIAQISDMSGYAIAYVTAMYGASCHLVKVVSGLFFHDDPQFQKTLERAHETISQYVIRHAGV